jgi:hypothetical protein
MKPDTYDSIIRALLIVGVLLACGFYVSFVVHQNTTIKLQRERIEYFEFEREATVAIAESMIDLVDLCLIERNDGLTPKP